MQYLIRTYELEACKNARLEAEDSISTDDAASKFRNDHTFKTGKMTASVCAVEIAQSEPNTEPPLHGTLPNTIAISAVVDLQTCRNQIKQPFEEEIPQTSYSTGTPRFLGHLARIRLHPILLDYLRLNRLRMLVIGVLSHLRSNSHHVLIILLLLFLPLLIQNITNYVGKSPKK